MAAKRLQRWWIAACAVALLLATWAGGFSLVATFIFGVIYLTGATMIGRDDDADGAETHGAEHRDTEAEPEAEAEPEPEPEPEPEAEAEAEAEK